MKREGRQHGMVRTYRILSDPFSPRPDPRIVNSPPTAGLFSKVPSKPTNHSKFTGKSRCINSASKSKDKAKGSHKLRSSDNLLLAFSGFSASLMLDQLAPGDYDDVDDDQIVEQFDDDREEEDEIDGEIREDEGEMSFCEVGFVLEEVEIDCGDEDGQGWCVVAEL